MVRLLQPQGGGPAAVSVGGGTHVSLKAPARSPRCSADSGASFLPTRHLFPAAGLPLRAPSLPCVWVTDTTQLPYNCLLRPTPQLALRAGGRCVSGSEKRSFQTHTRGGSWREGGLATFPSSTRQQVAVTVPFSGRVSECISDAAGVSFYAATRPPDNTNSL